MAPTSPTLSTITAPASTAIVQSPFHPDIGYSDFKNIQEFREHLDKQNRVSPLVDASKGIKFGYDQSGKITMDYGSGVKGFTENGFTRFCKMLHVPARYIANLPSENASKDLLATLHRSKLSKFSLVLLDDQIVGATPKEETVSTLEIIDRVFADGAPFNIKGIGGYKGNSIIYFTTESAVPIVNDQIDYGMALSHDDSMAGNPMVDFYFWRQICSNGAVARKLERLIKISNRMPKDKMFEVLINRIGTSLDSAASSFSSAVSTMSRTPIPTDDKKYLKSYIGSKFYFKDNQHLETKFETLIRNNDAATYYDLMNYITDSAKDFPIDESHRFLALGGDMVAHFKENKPTLDVFTGFTEFKRKKIYKETLAV